MRLILGVQLDDVTLFYRQVDIFSCRKRGDLAFELIGVNRDPLRSRDDHISKLLEFRGIRALFLNSDDISFIELHGRDIGFLSVYEEMTVGNELSGFSSGSRKSHSVYYIVESSFEHDQKVFTCIARCFVSLFKSISELLFLNSVDELCSLLFSQLKTIVAHLLEVLFLNFFQ